MLVAGELLVRTAVEACRTHAPRERRLLNNRRRAANFLRPVRHGKNYSPIRWGTHAMPISLTHLGEAIVAEIANRSRRPFLNACGLLTSLDFDFVESVGQFAFHEVRLARIGNVIFDGYS